MCRTYPILNQNDSITKHSLGAALKHLSYKDDTPEDVGWGILRGIIGVQSIGVCICTIGILFSLSVSFGRLLGLQGMNKNRISGFQEGSCFANAAVVD